MRRTPLAPEGAKRPEGPGKSQVGRAGEAGETRRGGRPEDPGAIGREIADARRAREKPPGVDLPRVTEPERRDVQAAQAGDRSDALTERAALEAARSGALDLQRRQAAEALVVAISETARNAAAEAKEPPADMAASLYRDARESTEPGQKEPLLDKQV